ncbi:hypothetical protein B0T16DRAFT_296848, partial [Cercophora newfieldiana]
AVVILTGGSPKPYTGPPGASSAIDFFRSCAPNEPGFRPSSNGSSPGKLIMGDRSEGFFDYDEYTGRAVLPSTDSFIRGAIQAWSEHLHLVLEPDVVWLTILTQLSFYMRANQDKVRHVYDFASRPGTQIYEFPDWYLIMVTFYGAVVDRIKEEWVYEFIRPYFSTTSDNHIMVSHIIMMGFEKTEFVYDEPILCGLPSVMLDGELRDWENILARLDRFPTLGAEAAAYAARLRPVLSRIVSSFKEPDSEASRSFWNQVVIAEKSGECGGAPLTISGWITAFLFWDVDGEPYGRDNGSFVLDGVAYPGVNIRTLPSGYAKAPFVWGYMNSAERRQAYAMAGVLGKRVEAGAPAEYVKVLEEKGLNGSYVEASHGSLVPLSSWALIDPVVTDSKAPRWVPEEELVHLGSSLR